MCQHETKYCGRCTKPFECKAGISSNVNHGVNLTRRTRYIAAISGIVYQDCLLAIKKEVYHESLLISPAATK